VWVKDTYSFVEIKNDSKDVLTNISEIKGHNIKIQVANPKKPSFANKNRNPRNRFQNKNK
jgi:hypothetical protein